VATARSRWRWLALAYPALTTLAVVVTANHFWLDGIAAAALLALAMGVQHAARPAWHALSALHALPAQARRLARRTPALVTAGVAGMATAAGAAGMFPLFAGGTVGRAAGSGAEAGHRGAGSPERGRAQAIPADGAAPAQLHASHCGRARRDGGCAAKAAVSAAQASRDCQGRRSQSGRAGQSREQGGR